MAGDLIGTDHIVIGEDIIVLTAIGRIRHIIVMVITTLSTILIIMVDIILLTGESIIQTITDMEKEIHTAPILLREEEVLLQPIQEMPV